MQRVSWKAPRGRRKKLRRLVRYYYDAELVQPTGEPKTLDGLRKNSQGEFQRKKADGEEFDVWFEKYFNELLGSGELENAPIPTRRNALAWMLFRAHKISSQRYSSGMAGVLYSPAWHSIRAYTEVFHEWDEDCLYRYSTLFDELERVECEARKREEKPKPKKR